jgi:hypothetical protein
MSKDKLFQSLRDEERVQFARLIDEMIAALPVKIRKMMIADMATSMDLTEREVRELLSRALTVWENAKP